MPDLAWFGFAAIACAISFLLGCVYVLGGEAYSVWRRRGRHEAAEPTLEPSTQEPPERPDPPGQATGTYDTLPPLSASGEFPPVAGWGWADDPGDSGPLGRVTWP